MQIKLTCKYELSQAINYLQVFKGLNVRMFNRSKRTNRNEG